MDKFLSTLGLARRAGKILLGVDSLTGYRKPVALLIYACDASPRVKRALAERRDPSVTPDYTKEQLGRAVGCKEAAVIAVTDAGFAGVLRNKLESQEENE